MKIAYLAAAIGLAVCVASTASASSTRFSFGETNVTVRAEDSFCALDSAETFDRNWLNIQIKANAGRNEVAGAYMLCNDLARLRKGEKFDLERWIILLSPLQGGNKAKPFTGFSRPQLMGLLAKEFAKGVKVDVAAVNKSVDKAAREVLGDDNTPPIEISGDGAPYLLAKTDDGVFAGLKLQVTTQSGPMPVGAVIGMTLVNDHLLSVNVYRQFKDPKTINLLLAQASAMIRDIVEQNP